MPNYSYTGAAKSLGELFSLEKEAMRYPGDNVLITNCLFRSHALRKNQDLLDDTDKSIRENHEFTYIIFSPSKRKPFQKAIIMFHGLNERFWGKYLPWASYLCSTLQRPVVLFPLAFHMNRSAAEWLDKKNLDHLFSGRKTNTEPQDRVSSANTVLSERIEGNPLRFFSSGLQTYLDIIDLIHMLQTGNTGPFASDTVFDIFGYSIGALIGEMLLMCNPEELFGKSRLFLFCGGSVLSRINMLQRTIMDRKASQALQIIIKEFLETKFGVWTKWRHLQNMTGKKELFHFKCMLGGDSSFEERNSQLYFLRDRIMGISLSQDKVVPTVSMEDTIGQPVKEMNFPYPCSHDNPFPLDVSDSVMVDKAFLSVFNPAVEFFG